MKQGEVQKGRDLAYSSDENRSLRNFSENTPIDDDDESSQATNCDNQEGFSKGESKWERFLEISSIDDNGNLRFFY